MEKRHSTLSYDSFDEENEGNDGDQVNAPTINQPQWRLETDMKIGFAGEWYSASIEIEDIVLIANANLYSNLIEETLNIKKIKKCEIVSDETRIKNLDAPMPASPIIIIEYVDKSVYLMPDGGLHDCKHIEMWIEGGRTANENQLEDQQLSTKDIPVIVDKCIKFITTQGCLTEGIYRIAGINSRIIALSEEFRRNAWAVQLHQHQYSEHDVANTLKRFFRKLDNPLLTKDVRSLWIESSCIDDIKHKLELYRQLLSEIPKLNYLTLRRLIVHLRTVSQQSEHNRMPVSNLAALWGPNILTTDSMSEKSFSDSTSEATVISDLINYFDDLFDVNDEEVNRDKSLLQVAIDDKEQDENDSQFPTRSRANSHAGDIKVWIYVDSKTEGQHVCLVIYPKMTVMEATTRVWQQLDKEYKVTHILHEMILKEELERPMHHEEIVWDSILKWSDWQEEDRKYNYLVLKEMRNEFKESLKRVNPSIKFYGEVNYSPNAAKKIDIKAIRRVKPNFSKCLFEIKGDYVICSKKVLTKSMWKLNPNTASIGNELRRKSMSLMSLAAPDLMDAMASPPAIEPEASYELLSSWLLNSIFWYYGTETKRNSPSEFNITFITKDDEVKRSRSEPYFGEAVSFESREIWITFVAALLQQNLGGGSQKQGRPHGIPSNKKPPKPDIPITPQTLLNTDIVEELDENDEFDSVVFRFHDTRDGNLEKDNSEVEDKPIAQIVSKFSMDNDEKESLKQLLSSLSIEKQEIDRRVVSGNYKKPNLSAKIVRSSSFSPS